MKIIVMVLLVSQDTVDGLNQVGHVDESIGGAFVPFAVGLFSIALGGTRINVSGRW